MAQRKKQTANKDEKREPGVFERMASQPPEPPKNPVTKPGDIWTLGAHRLICGDSREVAPRYGAVADMVWTDPPYGVVHVGGTRAPRDKKNYRSGPAVLNDGMGEEELGQLIADAVRSVETTPGAAAYFASPAGYKLPMMIRAFVGSGYEFKHTLVWVKSPMVFGRSDYHYRHELVLYGWKPDAGHRWYGGRKQDTVFEFDQGDRGIEHPTSKPIGLVARHIANSSKRGGVVADPFSGGGSTLLSAEQLERIFVGSELSPAFCDVAVQRWEELTGGKAKRRRN